MIPAKSEAVVDETPRAASTREARTVTPTALAEPDAATIAELDRMCDESKFLAAHGVLQRFAPALRWHSASALCNAGRVVHAVGAPRLACRLWLKAHRIDPHAPETVYRAGSERIEHRGPLAAWEWLDGYELPPDCPPSSRVYLHWLRAQILTMFRDFERAGEALAHAERDAPLEPYNDTMRIAWLCAQDRFDEALEKGRAAVERAPSYRGSIQSLSHVLALHGKFEEALELVREKGFALDCGTMLLEAARIELELERYREALATLEAAVRCMPLLESAMHRRIAGMRSTAALHLGDDALAIAEAKRTDEPFFTHVAERLTNVPAGSPGCSKVLLDVAFVRQHRLTCVPATLATLARFWKKPADQLEIAERICYDGTPAASSRRWAHQHGWVTREFSATFDVTRALLDRGIPFMVDTVHATSAHAQAIIGYDERCDTLQIRDPFVPGTLETVAARFFDAFKAHGPRGLAMVPTEEEALFDGIEFPDAALYDLTHAIDNALQAHDRARALAIQAELDARAPAHRLSVWARRAIAAYDENFFELEKATEAALVMYPDEPTLIVSLLAVMRKTSTTARYRERLEELCRDPQSHPVFLEMLASERAEDGRELEHASTMLRKVAKSMRDRATTIGLLANAAWKSLDYERALELYRFAACLEPTDPRWPDAYFIATLARGRSEEGLTLLRERAARYLRRSAVPSYSLFSALQNMDRVTEAFDVLDRARQARPDDGDLLRFAADAHARYGQSDKAAECLRAAESCSARPAWLRTASFVASSAGQHERSIELLREAVAFEPMSVEAHAGLAQRLAASYGAARAREHLAEASARFPENSSLFALRVQWLTNEDPVELEHALKRLLELEPVNAWARRELVLTLCKLDRVPEARAECELARGVAGHEVQTELVAATVARLEGDAEAEKSACWAALDRSVDSSLAISSLVRQGEDEAKCRAILASIEERVTSTSVTGDGIAAWYEAARRHLAPEELTERLVSMQKERADLWWVWVCTARHHASIGDATAAVATADELVRRFPLLPGSWMELAKCLRTANHTEREIEALERAVSIAPGFVAAVCELSNARHRGGAEDSGVSVLERGLHHQPHDAALSLALADKLWLLDREDEALAAVRRAIEADPSVSDPWNRLQAWSDSTSNVAVDLAQELIEKRPWDVQLLLRFAELEVARDLRSALLVTEKAIEIDPLFVDAHDMRAVIAARLGDRALAEAACQPARLQKNPPMQLRARRAWVAAAFGDFAGAVERMKAVVKDRPDCAFGFSQLADWAERVEDKGLAIEAARALVRLDPTLPYSHGYLGQALAEAGDEPNARRSFRRALELDPSYRYGAHRYLDLVIEAKELEEARATLARIERHLAKSDVAFLEIKVALAWNATRGSMPDRWKEAEPAARRLFSDSTAPDGLLEEARRMLTSAHARWTERLLRESIDVAEAPRQLAALWARTCVQAGLIPSFFALRRLRQKNVEAAALAMDTLLNDLAEKRRTLRARWIALWHLRFMRSRDDLWGSVGYVLLRAKRPVLGALWLRDYKRRKATPWMLLNLAIALRELGFVRRAAAASRRALELPPDNTSSSHRTLLALNAGLAGRADEAEALLANVATNTIAKYYNDVKTVAAMLVELELERAPRESRVAIARDLIDKVETLRPSSLRNLLSLELIQWRRVKRRAASRTRNVWLWSRGYGDTVGAYIAYFLAAAALTLAGIVVIPTIILMWLLRLSRELR